MAVVDSILIALEENIQNANTVKEIVVGKLIDEGLLTNDEGTKFVEEFQIILVKRRWFTRWFNKLKLNSPDANSNEYEYRIVKL